MSETPPLTRIYAKLTIMTLFWGGTFVAGRTAVQTMEPISVAFCRYAIATVLLLILTLTIEGGLPRLKRKHILPIVTLGLSGIFAYNFFFFQGLQTIPASRASLIVTTNPTVIALCSALLFGDRLTPLRVLGIACALSGAVTVISNGHPLTLLSDGITQGDLFLIGCVASWVVYTLVGKIVMADLSPFAATTYACLVGTPLFIVPAMREGFLTKIGAIAPVAWFSVVYLAVLGTVVAFCWYYEGLRAIGPARASIFINLVPVVAVLFGVLLLNEPLTPALIIGGLLVVFGVFLTNRRPPTPPVSSVNQ
jgi:drug/metabolite transporter (DMT)-like permease